jgi:hypothetical protein
MSHGQIKCYGGITSYHLNLFIYVLAEVPVRCNGREESQDISSKFLGRKNRSNYDSDTL